MRTWRKLQGEHLDLYCPIGLWLVDSLTGKGPIGWIRATLDVSDGAGGWLVTGVKPVVTLSGILVYPGLEKRANVAGQPPRRYRVRIEAEFYIPWYRKNSEGIEFDAYPWNDANPPQVMTNTPQKTLLVPAPYYPFPSHLLVLRGVVVDPDGAPVADAEVNWMNREQVLTDKRGAFGLPLRLKAAKEKTDPQKVDAFDHRNGKTAFISVKCSDAVKSSQTIIIS
jgi:hypothetical protein